MQKPYFPNIVEKLNDDLMMTLLTIHKQLHAKKELSIFLNQAYEEYWTWNKFSNSPLPESSYDHLTLWLYMKIFLRSQSLETKGLVDIKNSPFSYKLTNSILKEIHYVDIHLSDNMVFQNAGEEDHKEEWLKQRIIHALMEEAITSSQIEGAATTRKQAKEMIKAGKKPKTQDEKMIINNYSAIIKITKQYKTQKLSPELIKKIHQDLTAGLLENPEEEGSFRKEQVNVHDADQEVLFIPPPYAEVEQRIQALCDFANDDQEFVHPVIKAIILHFMIGYIHPFTDGNGRTARGLFYWYLISKQYKLFEYVSISEMINQSKGQYKRAYLNTECDGGDLNYFIYYHLSIIRKSIEALEAYVEKKVVNYHRLRTRIKRREDLNYRQIDLLNHAINHKDFAYTIKNYQNSNAISWGTARSDLLDLAKKGFLEERKRGKELNFLVVENIEGLLNEEAVQGDR